jgi:putative protein kinase ArgK-like GTPase of G3E family
MVVDLLAMARDFKGRNPSVLKVSAAKRDGIETVVGVMERIRAKFLASPSKGGDEIRLKSIKGMITELARRRVLLDFEERADSRAEGLAARVAARETTIDEAADELFGARERRRRKRGG